MMKNRQQLKLKDFLKDNGYSGINTYTKYSTIYEQEFNELCRFPELSPLFDLGYSIEWAPSWNFLRLSEHYNITHSTPDMLPIVRCFYNAFSGCKNLAIVLKGNNIEVHDMPMFRDEDFKTFRNRNLFKVRDFLGIHHGGKGEDSKRLTSRYTKMVAP